MANNYNLSNTAANAAGDALSDLLDNGYLRIYDSTQATDADTALGAQVLLAELRFANPMSGAASGGVVTASALTADSSANATGTATWFRALKSDGTAHQVKRDGANANGYALADLRRASRAIDEG